VSRRLRWKRGSLIWTPPSSQLKLTSSAPVTIVREPRPSWLFSYSDEQWVRVMSARDNAIWPLESKPALMLRELERAGQAYREAVCDPKARTKLRRALKQARDHVALARASRFSPPQIAELRAAVKVFESKLSDPRAARTALARAALRAWSKDVADWKFSRNSKQKPDGALIRYLEAVLAPLLGEVGRETLAKIILRERRRPN
jgi:hypothetical protein